MQFISHIPFTNQYWYLSSCGKGGIRTPDTLAGTPHFECGPFNHSGTFPDCVRVYKFIP